jgi:hypothetical protein
MEIEQFDDLTRDLISAGSTRRSVIRALGPVLFAGALGAVAARLGPTEETAAKAKSRTGKSKGSHQPPAHQAQARQARPAQEQKASIGVQSEGKGKKKPKHHKKPKHPKPTPPLDPPCPEDQGQCPDGTCLPFDQCCKDQYRCPDKTCVSQDDCCPGEKKCPPDSESGSATRICVGADDCCTDQKTCGDGCIPVQACCDEDPYPLCGPCDTVICDVRGHYVCAGKCCPNQKPCPDGTCVGKNECCPDPDLPACPTCFERRCYDGYWTCDHIPCCFDCPEDFVVCPAVAPIGSSFGCCPKSSYAMNGGGPYCVGMGWCDNACTQQSP